MADDEQTTPNPDPAGDADAEAPTDPAGEAERAVDAAADAADDLAEQAASPAAPVDEEVDAQTAAALKAAQEAIAAVKAGVTGQPEPEPEPVGASASASPAAAPYQPPPITGAPARTTPAEVELLADVNLNVKIELGRTQMVVEDVLKLGAGAVVELDKAAGDPVDIYVNDRRVARGEVLVINDCFCVRVSEIVASPDAA